MAAVHQALTEGPRIPTGAIPQPRRERLPPVQVVVPVRCPYCETLEVQARGTHDGIRYYRCRRCACLETKDWTTFKVRVTKGEACSRGEGRRSVTVDVQRDRHRPQRSVGQPHVVDDGVVLLLVEKAGQRREASVGQQFQVAKLAVGQIPGGEVDRCFLEFGGALGVDDEVDEVAAVGRDEILGMTAGHKRLSSRKRLLGEPSTIVSVLGPRAESGLGSELDGSS